MAGRRSRAANSMMRERWLMFAGESENHAASGRRVLVIDDSPAVRDAMRGPLQQWGLQVAQAADEAAAWAAWANPAAMPHAVLADLRLANGVSGLQLALRLRALLESMLAPPPVG